MQVKCGNSEGSLYQSSDGWHGYIWCTRPDGTRYRRYVRGKTYEKARQNWVNLREQASRGPVSSSVPKLDEFLAYWLKEIVEPNLAPKTYKRYEMFSRLHILPYLGGKNLDKIQVKDIRQWLNKLAVICQCCTQGKDPRGLRIKGAAAQPGNAVAKRSPRAAAKTHVMCSVPR
jgi:hypothetical protein